MAVALVPFFLLSAAPAHADGTAIEPIDLPELPYCDDAVADGSLLVELLDVPEGAPATEWQEFTYRVTNLGDEPAAPVYAQADMWTYPDDGADDPFPFAFEWNVNGAWRELQFESDYANGYFGIVRDLQPGESAEARLRGRSRVDRSGWAELTARARHDVAEGQCVTAKAEAELILESAGPGPTEPTPDDPSPTEPTPEPTAPEPTTPPVDNRAAPRGDELADTGADARLPVVAALAAGTVAAGAGVLVVARRRNR
ncbi:hypothetical protein GCM10022245_46200 [Streptomyces mayteni]